MSALANAMGMEGRLIGVYNSPIIGYAHVLVEIKWGEEWHLFDPLYGVAYFRSPKEISNILDADMISIEDIRKEPRLAANTISINPNYIYGTINMPISYQNKIAKQYDHYLMEGDKYSIPNGINTCPEFFETAEPFGPIGFQHPMIFPAYFNLENGKAIYGLKDFSSNDLRQPGEIYAAMDFIGSEFISPNHEYRMSNLEINREYRLRIGTLESNKKAFEINISGDNLKIKNETQVFLSSQDTLDVYFYPTASDAVLRLLHGYTNGEYIYFDYISIEKVN